MSELCKKQRKKEKKAGYQPAQQTKERKKTPRRKKIKDPPKKKEPPKRLFLSRRDSVDIAWEHRAFLDVGDAEEAGGDTLQADGEASVRGHAIFPAPLCASVPAYRLSLSAHTPAPRPSAPEARTPPIPFYEACAGWLSVDSVALRRQEWQIARLRMLVGCSRDINAW